MPGGPPSANTDGGTARLAPEERKIMDVSQLSSQWRDHTEFHPCAKGKLVRAEATCPCGITERHTHCPGCGKLATKGDWDAPPKSALDYWEGKAYHEAGHAVVAAHLHVRFKYVTLEDHMPVPGHPGYCQIGHLQMGLPKHRTVRMFRLMRKRGSDGFRFRPVSAEEAMREYGERLIVVLCAGKAAEKLCARGEEEDSTLGDRRGVQETCRVWHVPESRVVALEKRAQRLVARPYIAEAIEYVVTALLKLGGKPLSAREVRALYRCALYEHAIERAPEPEED